MQSLAVKFQQQEIVEQLQRIVKLQLQSNSVNFQKQEIVEQLQFIVKLQMQSLRRLTLFGL